MSTTPSPGWSVLAMRRGSLPASWPSARKATELITGERLSLLRIGTRRFYRRTDVEALTVRLCNTAEADFRGEATSPDAEAPPSGRP